MKKSLLFLLLSFSLLCATAQDPQIRSIHREELEYYNAQGIDHYTMPDSLVAKQAAMKARPSKAGCNLEKIVFGYHPYWLADTVCLDYRWDLISDLCFFSYEVDTLTGNPKSTHGWATARVVDSALANGVRVHLCVTLFDGHSYFLNNATAKQNLITNLINLVQTRGADGVNIDFEGVPSSQKTNLTAFLIDLCNQMHTAIPGSKVSIASPAVNWSGTFEITTLNNYLDWFVIMGYDYYWSGSTTSGPLSGLYSMTCGTYDNLSRTLTYYLANGATNDKVVLALPYYGREWHTTSSTIPSSTIAGTSASRTYRTVRMNTSGYYSLANRHWEPNSLTPVYVFNDGTAWHQCFSDDEKSLEYRYDMVYLRDIAGIGIWALGYDDDYPELWNLIEDKLTDCRVVPCSDTLYDLGGPACNHFDSENFTWTLAPTGAMGVSMTFNSFSLESGYDSLWIYDGPGIASPLIGGYSGTVSPGTVTATGNSMTLRYHSDNATTRPGWEAVWNCSSDNILPETTISTATWETQDFTANFTDTDNLGVDKKFYQVLDFNGTEWRANSSFGFFNDNFNTSIHPEWTADSGSWSINVGHLNQTDVANGNTNIYASLAQDNTTEWLYHWQMNLRGSVANRRAGMHFFCDSAEGDNRGNSYFVYYRADDDKVQIYKCVNDVYSMKTNIACVIDTGTWYDCKVTYDPQGGAIRAYLNNALISEWTDASPLSTGNAISLRTGNCNALYDDVKVYRSRTSSALITLGPAANVRYQNPDPATASCRIKSIVTDVSGWWSNVGTTDVNIDWTPADTSSQLNDGPAADLDTTTITATYTANWTAAVDPHSGVTNYLFALGTGPCDSNIVNWTDIGNVLSNLSTGLSLLDGQWYYCSLKAVNGAGLTSSCYHSDGILIETGVGLAEAAGVQKLNVFPNPFVNEISVDFELKQAADLEFVLTAMNGASLLRTSGAYASGKHIVHLQPSALASGSTFPCVLTVIKEGKTIYSIRILHSAQ